MIALTHAQLAEVMRHPQERFDLTVARARKWLPHLLAAMERYRIDTPARAAAFIAQVLHESGRLLYVRELGAAAYFAKYDTGPIAARLGNTPGADGDGARYKGRGLIQVTGTTNYRACGTALGLPLLAKPELLEEPANAALSAAWFWSSKSLNDLADKGEFDTITRRINGGTNGAEERRLYWGRAKAALGVA